MDIEVKPKGAVTLVRLSGRIVDGKPADLLQDSLKKLVRAQRAKTVFDLEDVTYFDSLAIGILVSHYASVTQLGGGIVILKANDKIHEMMTIAKLADRFGWANELDEALAWFDGES